jgi:DNA mismatch endonuclease (patch repair protein)
MARIRSLGNKDTELALANIFRAQRITGWRRHAAVFGRPDFIFPKLKVALFVDGCFWHGCPKHATLPKNNREFWQRKLAANRARDALVTRMLRRAGWRVVRVWEHELARKHQARLLNRIRKVLAQREDRASRRFGRA